MDQELILTDEYVASILVTLPGWQAGTMPIEFLRKMVQRSLGGHLIVAPNLTIQETLTHLTATLHEAVLLSTGELGIHGRVAGIWRPFVFESMESDEEINAVALFQTSETTGFDSQFMRSMTYLRDTLASVTPPLYYVSANLAFTPDGSTIVGITLAPDLVGPGIVAMGFLPLDSSA